MAIGESILIKKLKIGKNTKILDIGGAMKQHERIKIDTLVDIIRPEEAPYRPSKLKAKKFIKVDITKEKLPFKNNEFEVCLCTHTLEDLYDPFPAINEMSRVAKRGYIATPAMGADMVFSHIDMTDWLSGASRVPGKAHHKWFFVNDGGVMKIIPKNYGILYTSNFQIVDWNGEEEFELFWYDRIDIKEVSDLSIHALIDEYQDFVNKNRSFIRFGRVLAYYDNPIQVTKAYLKYILKRGAGFKFRKIRKT